MPGERGGAVGCLLHRQRFLVHSRGGLHLLQQYFCIAANHHEEIIEIVRHPAGQASHSFHLLCLAELIFQHPPFRDVFGNDLQDLLRFGDAGNRAPA